MKKIALFIIILAIIVCCLFPPWQRIYKEHRSNIKKIEPVGYSFIADPPIVKMGSFDRPKYVKADTIDFSRLGVQVGLLLFLGSCIVFSKHIFPPTKPKPKSTLSDESPPKKKSKWIASALVFICILVVFGYGVFITMLYFYTENQCAELREDNNQLVAQLSPQEHYSSEQRNAAYEELLADLDSEYGTECRAEAVKKFNQLAANGKVPKGNPAMATRIMERCYKEVKAKKQQSLKRKGSINLDWLDGFEAGLEAGANEDGISQQKSRLNLDYVESLLVVEHPDHLSELFDFFDDDMLNPSYSGSFSDELKVDAYGPGIHMNQYGQPVRLRPDFGGVPGESLQIKPNAYGPGTHMDQYGRPVREHLWP